MDLLYHGRPAAVYAAALGGSTAPLTETPLLERRCCAAAWPRGWAGSTLRASSTARSCLSLSLRRACSSASLGKTLPSMSREKTPGAVAASLRSCASPPPAATAAPSQRRRGAPSPRAGEEHPLPASELPGAEEARAVPGRHHPREFVRARGQGHLHRGREAGGGDLSPRRLAWLTIALALVGLLVTALLCFHRLLVERHEDIAVDGNPLRNFVNAFRRDGTCRLDP